jgi:hypothetical protein
LKVAKIIQIRPTSFKDGVPKKNWWKWFQKRNPNISIRQIERLEVSKTQGLTPNFYTSYYSNLATLYEQHKYKLDHIWNLDKTKIQVGRPVGIKVLAKRGS